MPTRKASSKSRAVGNYSSNGATVVNYIYCFREQALREDESVCFKIGHANDLDRRKSSMQTANPRPLRTVFVLGPFLCRDEAEDVESQAHKLLARYRVRGEWFDVNPLTVQEFWDWVDAQLLPICVQEKSAIPEHPTRRQWATSRLNRQGRRKYGNPYLEKKPKQGSFDLN